MAGLAVYTTDYDPQRVYVAAGAPADRALVEQVVRYSDAPLELVVDCGSDGGGRVVWPFKGKRGAATDRTTSFVADFTAGPEEDLFAAFAAALRDLHEEWHLPPQGDLRGDLGFSLWRLTPGTPGLDAGARTQLWRRLDADSDAAFARPAVVGMRTLRSALQVVRACQAAAVEARVAVATAGDPTTLSGIDLVVVPGGDADFVPQSPGAETLLGAITADAGPGEAPGSLGTDGGAASVGDTAREQADTGWGPSLVAIAVVVVSLAGVVVLYRGNAAPRFLGVGAGCGIVATGVVLGIDRLAARRPWLTIGCLGMLVLGAGGAGGLYALNIVRSGAFATVVAGAYLGFLMSFGLYSARTAIVAGADAVVPGLRSLR